jgi:thiamine biosynthesis lipoprotein
MESAMPHVRLPLRTAASRLLTACALLVACSACSAPLRRFEFEHGAMGTTFRIVLYAEAPAAAAAAAAAAFARIAELDDRLSDWSATSELTTATRAACASPGTPVAIGPDLARVLVRSLDVAAASFGAFDPTIGPCVQLWRRSRRRGELPDAAALAGARAAVGWRKLVVDRERGTMTLAAPAMALDLGAIAKGDALEEALAVLARHGVERALVSDGGGLAASGPPPGRDGWIVALAEIGPDADAPPPARVAALLAHGSIATSGDTFRAFEVDGTRYSHLVDPRTGLGLTRRVLVAAFARDGATADALATALSLVEPERAASLLARFPGASARLVTLDAAGATTCTFAGLPPMIAAPTDPQKEAREEAPEEEEPPHVEPRPADPP